MNYKKFFKGIINFLYRLINLKTNNTFISNFRHSCVKKIIKTSNLKYLIRKEIVSLILLSSLWVQVPQWENDWSKCSVDIPDSSCHWYIKSPDNTFGEGFDWNYAPFFDINGLNDIAKVDKETVLEKLQKR